MANLAAYEFWRLKWVRTARIQSLIALAASDGREVEAEILATSGAWDGMDDAQRDWCLLHGLAPLALTAVQEVVERIIQVCHCHPDDVPVRSLVSVLQDLKRIIRAESSAPVFVEC